MSEPASSLLEFPCDFPIKAFARSQDSPEDLIFGIIRRHVPDLEANAMVSRSSSGGLYTAVTVSIRAHNQAQLDAIYRELSSCPEIIMVF